MAAAPIPLAPPPSPNGAPAPPPPTSPPVVSPAPAKPAPQMQAGTNMVLKLVSGMIELAKMFPAVSPEVRQVNDLLRTIGGKIEESQQTGEPAAPPMNG